MVMNPDVLRLNLLSVKSKLTSLVTTFGKFGAFKDDVISGNVEGVLQRISNLSGGDDDIVKNITSSFLGAITEVATKLNKTANALEDLQVQAGVFFPQIHEDQRNDNTRSGLTASLTTGRTLALSAINNPSKEEVGLPPVILLYKRGEYEPNIRVWRALSIGVLGEATKVKVLGLTIGSTGFTDVSPGFVSVTELIPTDTAVHVKFCSEELPLGTTMAEYLDTDPAPIATITEDIAIKTDTMIYYENGWTGDSTITVKGPDISLSKGLSIYETIAKLSVQVSVFVYNAAVGIAAYNESVFDALAQLDWSDVDQVADYVNASVTKIATKVEEMAGLISNVKSQLSAAFGDAWSELTPMETTEKRQSVSNSSTGLQYRGIVPSEFKTEPSGYGYDLNTRVYPDTLFTSNPIDLRNNFVGEYDTVVSHGPETDWIPSTFLATGVEAKYRWQTITDVGIVNSEDSYLDFSAHVDGVQVALGGTVPTSGNVLSIFVNGVVWASRSTSSEVWSYLSWTSPGDWTLGMQFKEEPEFTEVPIL